MAVRKTTRRRTTRTTKTYTAPRRRKTTRRRSTSSRSRAPQTIKLVIEQVPANSLVHGLGSQDSSVLSARQTEPKKARF